MTRYLKPALSFFAFLAVIGVAAIASAQPAGADAVQHAQEVTHQGLASNFGLISLAAGLGIGLAALGGAIGQGRAAAAAFEGIARNPGARGPVFVPFILGLALIESLVIYALVISFMLVGKVG